MIFCGIITNEDEQGAYMSTLKELAEKIKQQKAIAASDPGNDPQTRRVRLGNITQAKEQLKDLRLSYRKLLLKSAAFIIVTGDQADKFAKTAEEKYDCFAVNAEDFYNEMIEKVPEVLYKDKISSGNLFEHIGNALEDKARDLDIVSYPALIFESKYKKQIKDKNELLSLTKSAINEKVGSEIVGIDAMDKISDKVLNSELSGKTIPVVLYTSDTATVEELSKGLKRSLTRNTHIIATGEVDDKTKNISLDVVDKVTTKAVEKSLLKIRQSLV
ncbi:MAG TPA: hypothetical protein DDY18_06185 [Flavobacterium sp.]|nr:hypothetical protein [Flavobacterium sp.]